MPWLINTAQLEKFRKSQKHVAVFDVSWHLETEGRNAQEEFLQSHIPGALFFNLNDFHDSANPLPNMLIRNENLIAEKLGKLGLTNDHKIIFYDNSKLHTSCRALWMLKVFGHNPLHLYVLDGGLESWKRAEGKTEQGEARIATARQYQAKFQPRFLRTLLQVKSNLHHPAEQVIDLRHPVRYAGGPEHRVGLRSGHIPRSFCFPFFTMFEANGNFKSLDRIRKQLSDLGVELNKPIITTCGSGISSAVLNFVLDLLHCENHALYDGSWAEWGSEQLYPGEESLAERPVETSLES